MWHFLRRTINFFIYGFIATFVVTLFILFDSGDVILAIVIAAGGGAATSVGLVFLERRFPDDGSPPSD